MRGSIVVGHVTRKILVAWARFLERNGTIQCNITGSRCFSEDLLQGGLEVPCTFKFQGEAKDVVKMRKLVVTIDTTPFPEPHQPSKKRMIECGCVRAEKAWHFRATAYVQRDYSNGCRQSAKWSQIMAKWQAHRPCSNSPSSALWPRFWPKVNSGPRSAQAGATPQFKSTPSH